MKTASYSDLRNNLEDYLDGVVNDCEPLVVHRAENSSVVIISIDEWMNTMSDTEYLMASPAMMDWLRKAEDNMNAGKGTKIDMVEAYQFRTSHRLCCSRK